VSEIVTLGRDPAQTVFQAHYAVGTGLHHQGTPEGKCKPQPLRGDCFGFWSRCIDREHRLVCRVDRKSAGFAGCHHA